LTRLAWVFLPVFVVGAAGGAEANTSRTNRLALEKSPYLLQHAHNPVDWHPWGEEAFARARREDKPIFLSVGYSTCHWCHVMERESFQNPATARLLNDNFVCVKVDREERPDVDRVYMAFVQATTGGGGWPMSVWLTPDLKPFYGGTYFPPEAKFDLPGFPELVKQIADAWRKDRAQLARQGDEFVQALQRQSAAASPPGALDRAPLRTALQEAASTFDPSEGGFGRAPKFPRPVALNFLLQVAAREGTNSAMGRQALEMTLTTLRRMAAGGIQDQLGGGFHRYSVDRFWHVPHFEKMLYDQAQLVRSYLDAHQLTQDPDLARTARDILQYVVRDLTDPDGGFASAEDADSLFEHGKPGHGEGAFYVWTESEINAVLGATNAPVFNLRYGVRTGGNAPDGSDPHREFAGKNILIAKEPVEKVAARFKRTPAEVETILDDAKRRLLEVRARRPRPSRDDKIITAWNGLMIGACARASAVLNDTRYLHAATRAASFIRERLYDRGTGELIRSYRKGPGAVQGFADDYAFLIQGLLDLYEASFDVQWLHWAVELQEKQDALFGDSLRGGYFSTRRADTNVLARMKEDYDGAEPSPNSIAVLNLLRLSRMTGREEFQTGAERTLRHFSDRFGNDPVGLPQMLVAVDWFLSKPRQIVLSGRAGTPQTEAMLQVIRRRYAPDAVLLLADGGAGQAFLGKDLEFIRTLPVAEGRTTAYVCESFVCQMPTDDPRVLDDILVRMTARK